MDTHLPFCLFCPSPPEAGTIPILSSSNLLLTRCSGLRPLLEPGLAIGSTVVVAVVISERAIDMVSQDPSLLDQFIDLE